MLYWAIGKNTGSKTMKKLMIAILLLAGISTAEAAKNDPLSTAGAFLKQCESTRKGTVEDTECITYAAGLAAGIIALQEAYASRAAEEASGEKPEVQKHVCNVNETPRELRDLLVRHLKKNRNGSKPTSEVFLQALGKAHPCKGE